MAADAGGAPMTVCMLATKFYARSDMGGGLERSARRLFEQLTSRGIGVIVLTRNYDALPREEVIDGVIVRRLPVWGPGRVLASVSYLAQALAWLIRHRREYALIHCHQSYAPATIGVLATLVCRKPVIVKISTSDAFSERRELERLPGFGLRRWLLQRVDRFVAVNDQARGEFIQLGIAPERLLHIPNGVPLPPQPAYAPGVRETARARVGLPGGRIVVFTGRLSTEKNLDVLLDAWPRVVAACAPAHLVLVGDGGTFRNAEPQLRAQAAAPGVRGTVRFIGRVPEVWDYLLAADLFVLPSKTEGMSNALLEAMAAGLPVVASRVLGNMALIQEQATGILVEPSDAGALAQGIIRLLTSDALAQALGRGARAAAQERFAIERVADLYQSLYAELLASSPPAATAASQQGSAPEHAAGAGARNA